jgi:hypothetical protein
MLSLVESFNGLAPGYFGISLSFTGTSEPVMIQAGYKDISVAIHPAVGQTARVEYTLSCQAEIDAGTAKWLTWPAGNVSVGTDDAMMTKAYAVRGVSSSGTAKLEVLAT